MAKDLRGSKCVNWRDDRSCIVMPAEAGIHDFSQCSTAGRGWCAFAHHDARRPGVISSDSVITPLALTVQESGREGLPAGEREWLYDGNSVIRYASDRQGI
jgi:hypothetical protein